MEPMFRMIWLGDSSNAKNAVRSPRLHAACFSAAGAAGDQDRGCPVVALAADQAVEVGNAGGNESLGCVVVQVDRGDGKKRDASRADGEGIVVETVSGSPVLDDPEPAGRHVGHHALLEEDHAVGHKLFKAVSRQLGGAGFARDDRRDALALEPTEESLKFGAEDEGV
jgi:hypothetical protein